MKKILALLLAVIMVMSMAACGKTDDNKGSANNNGGATLPNGITLPPNVTLPPELNDLNPDGTLKADNDGANITIKVWTPTEDQAEGNNWVEKIEADFKAKYPGYKNVKFENTTMGEGDAGAAVIADVTAAADVYMFANDQMGKIIKAGGLAKLVGANKQYVLDNNNDFMVSTVTHTDGELYGFPVTNNTWFMYYDKTVFSEEDVKSLDTMLTKGKVYLPFATGWTSGCIFLGCGGSIFGESGRDASVGIDFSAAKGGYTAAKKMIELVGNENVVAGGMDISKLKNGEVGAAFSGSWDAATLKETLGDKLGVAMLPTFTAEGKEYQMTAMSGSKCVGVNPNSNSVDGKQLACTEFAAFLASEEAQLARYTMRGVIPAHKTLKNNEKIAADSVAIAEIDTIAKASVIQSALPEMGNYWSPVETIGKNIIAGDVDMSNYQKAVDDMNNLLNSDGL